MKLRSKGFFRRQHGAAMFEYLIAISAVALIALSGVIPLGHEIKSYFLEIAGQVRNPPMVIISPAAIRSRTSGAQTGQSQTGSQDGYGSDTTGSNGSDYSGNDGQDAETDWSEADWPEDDAAGEDWADEGWSDSEGTDSSSPSEQTSCGPWHDFNFGFVKTQDMVQIHVSGDIIGLHDTKGNPGKTNGKGGDDSIDLDDVRPLGDAQSTYVLAIEYDGVHEYFTSHNRISLFSLDGEKIITRALVKYEEPGDLRQGDEYVIAHTKDFIVDLRGTLIGSASYTTTGQAGGAGVGNDDAYLSFHDIGCVIYRPTS